MIFWYKSVDDNLINCQYLHFNKNYSKKIDKNFKNRFKNTLSFLMISVNLFFLLRQEVCPNEFIDDWEKFNEVSLFITRKIRIL